MTVAERRPATFAEGTPDPIRQPPLLRLGGYVSRYMVNKLMWEVDRSHGALAAFKKDAPAFLDAWEALADRPVSPYPGGGTSTGMERETLVTRDYGSLYAMGANPFLLWQFARSVSVPDEMGVEELVTSFRVAVEPHGYPDFYT